jgi:BirA family biotin operon repressor/biotin-[acetyl-CoA-carboxylase] ligase
LPYPLSRISIGSPFIELQSVDSTNNYALSQVHAGLAENGMAVFAHEQVAGKGQRGKKWASSTGDNIALSIVIKPAPLGVLQQFQLSACAAVSLCLFFQKYAGEDTSIKWPNDLYWKDRKAGGILIESVIRSQARNDSPGEAGLNAWEWAVIGMGVNINQADFPAELANPVSLKQITGKKHDPILLAKELCSLFGYYYHILITEGFGTILPIYLSHFYKKDKKVKLKKGARVFEAVITGVTPEGKLVALHTIEEHFDHGEVQWVF